jgi:hypothetical protein
MITSTRFFGVAGAAALALLTSPIITAQTDKPKDDDPKRPKLTLRAQPTVAISPARVSLTAELIGGANDYEDFYCPTVEWNWGDGTRSQSEFNCSPYESGKSEIRRFFSVQHIFRTGDYHVTFRLKRRDKDLTSVTTDLRIQPSLSEIGDPGIPGRGRGRGGP